MARADPVRTRRPSGRCFRMGGRCRKAVASSSRRSLWRPAGHLASTGLSGTGSDGSRHRGQPELSGCGVYWLPQNAQETMWSTVRASSVVGMACAPLSKPTPIETQDGADGLLGQFGQKAAPKERPHGAAPRIVAVSSCAIKARSGDVPVRASGSGQNVRLIPSHVRRDQVPQVAALPLPARGRRVRHGC